ncbi:methylmalonyl-CoA carboxyltransferase [Gammaproteobacteria bacterium]|nr:methylmalonyl-CoA carboxyltransferase [Gammaproteobacteria bacterium]
MSWEKEVEELAGRRQLALAMGGEEGIRRQHERGKLTVRERIDRLVDAGSFNEFMGLTGSARYEGDELTEFTPSAQVEGFCQLDGRKVVLTGGDFTIRGGSGGGGSQLGMELPSNRRAQEWRVPYVRLLDASGGSVRSFEEMGRTYLPDGNVWSAVDVELLSEIPVVSAVMGSVAGLPAINACLAHFNLMVKDSSQLFPGGPPVVKASLGYDITKEELGGEKIHTRVSGVIDNLAQDEEDAFRQIKQFLSYLPANVWEKPPRLEADDDPARADESLLTVIPRDPRKTYKVHKVIDAVVDRDSFFEIAPAFGKSRVTGLARLDGYPVGVMANNPRQKGGSTDVAGGTKVMRLLQLCDTFHLPIVSFADEPGFMVGLESEKQGIERAGAALVARTCSSQMPWATVVLGKLYGVAGQCQHRPSGMFQRFAWPSANWGSMHIAGGASAAYRREIESADDPEAMRQEIEDRLRALTSPFRTAEATGQDIIDPRETRQRLCEFVRDAQRIIDSQLGQTAGRYFPF